MISVAPTSKPKRILEDGLYRVETNYLCAGFLVERGRITRCAPILRVRIDYWLLKAIRISR